MANRLTINPDTVALMSDKELAKQLRKTLKNLEAKQEKCQDTSECETIYWLLQKERLKRLKGKNF